MWTSRRCCASRCSTTYRLPATAARRTTSSPRRCSPIRGSTARSGPRDQRPSGIGSRVLTGLAERPLQGEAVLDLLEERVLLASDALQGRHPGLRGGDRRVGEEGPEPLVFLSGAPGVS